MATVPPPPDTTTPDSLPDTTPRPDEVSPMPGDVDVPGATPDTNPDSTPPGFHAPSTSVGERASDESDAVGGTDGMDAETGGLAGTSR